MYTFAGKTILITGASSGIGKALAFELAKENCNLILIARRKKLLNDLKRELRDFRIKVTPVKCDVGKKADVAAAYKEIKKEHDKIDIAILNAGVSRRITLRKYDSKIAEETFGANVMGIIYWIEQLLPDFLKRKAGWIVGISSIADGRGYSGSGYYCASKAAVTNYLEGLSIEAKAHGIKVTTVRPGFVITPMTNNNKYPMPFILSPEKAAKIILNGLQKKKRLIQFPLRLVLMSKLIELMPDRIYEYLAAKFKYN
ncbi:SDR family NAD(P)-dependent oxidoreductase [Bacteroidota bacterium]